MVLSTLTPGRRPISAASFCDRGVLTHKSSNIRHSDIRPGYRGQAPGAKSATPRIRSKGGAFAMLSGTAPCRKPIPIGRRRAAKGTMAGARYGSAQLDSRGPSPHCRRRHGIATLPARTIPIWRIPLENPCRGFCLEASLEAKQGTETRLASMEDLLALI